MDLLNIIIIIVVSAIASLLLNVVSSYIMETPFAKNKKFVVISFIVITLGLGIYVNDKNKPVENNKVIQPEKIKAPVTSTEPENKKFGNYASLIGFSANLPENYLIKKDENDNDESVILVDILINFDGNAMSICSVEMYKEISEPDSQAPYLEGMFNSFKRHFNERIEEEDVVSKEIDESFSPVTVGGQNFHYIKLQRKYTDMLVKQRLYVGFVNKHFVKIFFNNVSQKQLDDCLTFLSSIKFNA